LKTPFTKRAAIDLLIILVVCGATFFWNLGNLPLIGPDEPRYVEVAREMYVSGDWITPKLAGVTWFEKPALLYWLAMAGFALFGVSEFSARLGVAALSTGGVLLLYLFGKYISNRRYGIHSAMTLATMGLWIGFSRGATFDLPLVVATECAILSFFLSDLKDHKGRTAYWLLACGVAFGFGLLAKGLVGLVIPGLVIGIYLLVARRLRPLFSQPLLVFGASVLCLLTAGIWYGPMLMRHGWAFIDDFFIAHHVQRFLTDKYHHPQPFYFFFLVALGGSFPWTAFLLGAVGRGLSQVRARAVSRHRANSLSNDGRLDLLIWTWAVVPIVFFSFSGSKLPGYILSAFPAIGLLVGKETSFYAKRWQFAVTAVLMTVVAVGVAKVGPAETGIDFRVIRVLAITAICVGLVSLAISLRWGEETAIWALVTGTAILVITSVAAFYPSLGVRESLKDLAATARSQAREGERLVFYLDSDQGINYYATDLPLRVEKSELLTLQHGDEIAGLLMARGFESVLVMAYDRWAPGLEANESLSVERLGRQAGKIGCSPGCDWVLLRIRLRRN
jgi:4-amino-4-deoxy-L-arabinose transferase-like glycosyltransferase